MVTTIDDLPLSFKGKASSSSQLDEAIVTLDNILKASNYSTFVISEKGSSVIVRTCDEKPDNLSRKELLIKVKDKLNSIGDNILYLTSHPSEEYPEFHRDETITIQQIDKEKENTLSIEISVNIESAG